MLNENAYRDSVRERDLDNFLVEELSSSDDFRDWLLTRITAAFIPPETGDIRVRKSPGRASLDGRQTDVELGWFSGDDQQACVLLESKVTAEFQTGQAESYLGEIQAQLRKLGPKTAVAVLVAPAGKMASLQHNGAFAADVTIEEIITFLESRLVDIQEGELSRRLSVRIELLEALAGKRTVRWLGREPRAREEEIRDRLRAVGCENPTRREGSPFVGWEPGDHTHL